MKITIITNRLALKNLSKKDLERLYQFTSDKENTKYMYVLPFFEIEEAEHFLNKVIKEDKKEKPHFYELGVYLKGLLIGKTCIYYLDEERKTVEIGYILDKSYWNCGYGFEIIEAMISFTKTLSIKKIIAQIDEKNNASQKLVTKAGFKKKREQTRRNRLAEKDSTEYVYEYIC